MPKFAHLSDIHIGAFRQPELKELLLEAFDKAVDRCVEERVSFVIMSGDVFDSNIPDLSSVKRAARKIREARETGIRFYIVYGSHDFSPNYSSIVDVLESAGLFSKAERSTKTADGLRLEFIRDPSGAAICGLSGKKVSLDRADYESLDKNSLSAEEGLKIFVFHGAIDELKPEELGMIAGMPASYLPEGFDYYAGGHVHQHSIASLPGRRNIAYPGPLFATDFRDLEQMAKGEERGFYLVEFDRRITNINFEAIEVADVVELEYSADERSSREALEEIQKVARSTDIHGKVVLLKVGGQLASGHTSDIDFSEIRKTLLSRGPISVLLNYSQLTSRERSLATGLQRSAQATEREMFSRRIGSVTTSRPNLRGERGVGTSVELLKTLKAEKRENENKADYQDRTERAGLSVLGIGEEP